MNEEMKPYRRIVCAAIRNRLGGMILGVRHYDNIMWQQITHRSDSPYWKKEDVEQGFVDNAGNFVTREEAREIAKSQKQIVASGGGDDKQLFSENLY